MTSEISNCKSAIVTSLVLCTSVLAGLRIDLRPTIPTPPDGFLPGTDVQVDVWLVDTGNPQGAISLRSVFIDFNDSSQGFTYPDPDGTGPLGSGDFAWWNVPCGIHGCPSSLPQVSWVYPLPTPHPLFQITIPDNEEVRLGHLIVDVGTETGVLDALNDDVADPNYGARVDFGFGGPGDPVTTWRAYTGEITGGVLELLVADGDVDPELALISTDPFPNSVDARQPTGINGGVVFGWDTVDLTFNIPVSKIGLDDFHVSEWLHSNVFTNGPPVVSIEQLAPEQIRIHLAEPITPGVWTRILFEPTQHLIQLGYLPGDVNSDGQTSPVDILAIIDSLNGIVPRPIWSTDIDRSGIANPADILRLIDLLNGAGVFEVWNGETLPS